MKHLNDYIQESLISEEYIILEDANGNIIEEGFWKKLGKMFGFGTEKVKQTMKNWNKELRDAYVAGQIAAAKSKDSKTREAIKKQDAAAEKSAKDLLAETKLEVQRLMKVWDGIKMVDYAFAQYKQLTLLSEKENDSEGKSLAEKFKKLIDDKFPDGGKNYEQTVEKIDKSGVNKTEETSEKSEEKKEVTEDDIKTSISDNKDILAPLVNIFGGKINGEELAKKVEELMSKDPVYKTNSKAARTANTLGIASIICGAMMFKSHKCFERATEYIIDNEEKLRKAVPTKDLKLKTGENK